MPSSKPYAFDSVESAVEDIASGRVVIVTDDERRENEGDLIMAACKVTDEAVGMMIRHCSGIVCVATTSEVLLRLGLAPMVPNNRDRHRTDFAVSVDAAQGVTTGISAPDRARTIRLLGSADSAPDDLVRPGHVFPLRARPGGVLERPGHTEAAVDLAVLAGLHPSGVLCELMNDDGSVARLPDIVAFKERFGLRMIAIADLVRHRAKSCCGLPSPGSPLDVP
jgi:3,4-dihydroxy 2-butanone 4-phosphate synthase/GTP cyclohydrolase II